jgi:hypothetical protein
MGARTFGAVQDKCSARCSRPSGLVSAVGLRILLRRGGDAHAYLRQAASLASVAWLGLWGALLLPGTAATDPESESTEQKALDLRGAERGIEVDVPASIQTLPEGLLHALPRRRPRGPPTGRILRVGGDDADRSE